MAPDTRVGSWRQGAAVAALFCAVAAIVYYNSLDTPFIFDDRTNIVENPDVQQPGTYLLGKTRGLATLTFALNYAAHGLDVRGYHATNVAIHVLASLALFGVVRRTLLGRGLRERFARSATPLALCVALIWMVHPLQTGSVTYTVQRLESLMGLCFLGTLYCFRRGADAPSGAVWYAASVLCCVAGMRVKEVMFMAPLIVLWYDRAFVAPTWKDVWKRKYYYLALLVACGVLLGPLSKSVLTGLIPQFVSSADPAAPEGQAYSAAVVVAGVTPWSYLATQSGVILHYLRLSVWPVGLCLDYNWPIARSASEIWLPGLVILGLLAATTWAVFRRPAWGFLGGWFFVILAPTSSIVPIQDVAFEHRMYLPLAAVVVGGVIASYLGFQTIAERAGRTDAAKRWQVAIALIVIALLGGLTIVRNRDYRSNYVMWNDVVSKRPLNVRGHTNLGLALAEEQHDPKRAIVSYQEALRLDPYYPYAHYNLGNAYVAQGETGKAEEAYRAAIRFRPAYAEAFNNLGFVLSAEGEQDEALACFAKALEHRPDYAGAYVNQGLAYRRQGKFDDSLASLRKALAVDPSNAEAHNHLASGLAGRGELDEAIDHWLAALASKPGYAAAHLNLGNALQLKGRLAEAMKSYLAAESLRPGDADTQRAIGELLAARGDLAEALRLLRRACDSAPEDARTHAALAAVLARNGSTDEAIEQYRQALELDRAQGDVHHEIAILMAQSGKPEEALNHYQQAAELAPESAAVRVDLALLLERLGRPQEAVAWYREAIELKPDFAVAHLNLGSCLAGQNQLKEAIGHYQEAIRHDPGLADAHNNLANSLVRTGQLRLAVPHYQQALRLRPDYAVARQNLQHVLRAMQNAQSDSEKSP